MNKITINGVEITGDFAGRNIAVSNGNVVIDGNKINLPDEKVINIEITGNVERVESVSGSVRVTGNSGRVSTTSGNIHIEGSVSGDATNISGDIRAANIGGNVKTISGDIFK
jgi:DUF4097 and DUF4098 domain-containing protein YvlB